MKNIYEKIENIFERYTSGTITGQINDYESLDGNSYNFHYTANVVDYFMPGSYYDPPESDRDVKKIMIDDVEVWNKTTEQHDEIAFEQLPKDTQQEFMDVVEEDSFEKDLDSYDDGDRYE